MTYCKNMLKTCQNHAIKKEGLCLSKEYINGKNKLLWKCKNNHQWESSWNNVRRDKWCFKCFHKIPTINDLQQYAINKNGKLLTNIYVDNRTKMLWQCSEGHQWEAKWNNIFNQNQWCPYCANCVKTNISELVEYAKSKNGKLISTEYKDNKTSLIWECVIGHQWKARWNNIKSQNQWCPECSKFKTENNCKEIVEDIFGVKFNKTRFYYDINNSKKWFEYDGYNEEYKIAFEYHGIQHYEKIDYWQNEDDFKKQLQRDDFKEQYAAENNIQLIIIPYTESSNIKTYILNLVEKNVQLINYVRSKTT